jgi:hypothetical protein
MHTLLQDANNNGDTLPHGHSNTVRSSSRGRSNSPARSAGIGSPQNMQWPRRVASPDRVTPASVTAATAAAAATASASASASSSSADAAAAAVEEQKLALLATAVLEGEVERNDLNTAEVVSDVASDVSGGKSSVHSITVATTVTPFHTQHSLLGALEEVSTRTICILEVSKTGHKCCML